MTTSFEPEAKPTVKPSVSLATACLEWGVLYDEAIAWPTESDIAA